MAHFAELDNNNIVQQVVVISNEDILDDDGVEQENLGIELCQKLFGAGTIWVQTSFNNNFRKTYGGAGYKYDVEADLFYWPNAPYPSWTLNENWDWQPPVPRPTDGLRYFWDEDSLAWVEVPVEEPEP